MASTIDTNLASWTATVGTTKPASSDTADIDADMRTIQSVVRKYLATKGADIASADISSATIGLPTATGNYVHVTGVTTITSLGTVSAGMRFLLVFDGALTLTHNATSLILPGAANITTAAGDRAEFVSLGSGNWRCLWYTTAVAYSAVERTWTAQQTPMNGALTAGATVNWDADVNGQIVSLTLDQNTTMAAPTNINQHACYVIRITNGGSAYTVTWNAAYKFPGGVDHVMTATAGAIDIVTFMGGAGNTMNCIGQAKALA